MMLKQSWLFLVCGLAQAGRATETLQPVTVASIAGVSSQVAELGKMQVVTISSAQTLLPELVDPAPQLKTFCEEIDRLYARNKWGQSGCSQIPFEVFAHSSQGRPLVLFRGEKAKVVRSPTKLTIVQCGIHGDELPSVPMCFRLINEILSGKRGIKKGQQLIVQPLLNPDGMFANKPTRNNARGVDINRNFPTKNWKADAVKSWEKKDRKDPRKFPGETANSEPETQAIVEFIAREKPQKIISVHTPLGFLDLDAPNKNKDQERRAKFLAINIVKNSGNYQFRTFGVYPGSLGNYSGRERNIPVYTLELPGGVSPSTIDNYWSRFRAGFWRAIDFDLDTGQFVED